MMILENEDLEIYLNKSNERLEEYKEILISSPSQCLYERFAEEFLYNRNLARFIQIEEKEEKEKFIKRILRSLIRSNDDEKPTRSAKINFVQDVTDTFDFLTLLK